MRHKKLFMSALLLLGLGLTRLFAQQVTTTSGGDVSGPGGSMSYSIGQIANTTYIGANGSIAEGVQQPFEISIVTGIEEAKGISLFGIAYPNPTTDNVKLSIINYKTKDLIWQLYDINGKLIRSEKLDGNETTVIMSDLVAATYFLKVVDSKKELKTFKIIKN